MSAVAYVALFGAGVTTIAAPCVVPLLPVYATVVLEAGARGGRTALAAAGIAFVAGFSVVFVALGVAAGALGTMPGMGPWVTRAAAATLVVLGLVALVRPHGWSRWPTVRLLPRAARAGTGARWRPFAVGAAFAATWTPCVGPLLGAALVTAGAGSDPVTGGGLLAAYSVGLAVPFLSFCLAASAAGGALPGTTRRLGRHAVTAQRVAGGLLVLLGILLVGGRPGWVALVSAGG